MKKITHIFNQNHKGVGGLYFVTTSIICSMIMTISLQLSWDSQVVSMADNLAYITSINTTVSSYVNKMDPYEVTNPVIYLNSGGTYEPLKDFNQMLKDSGISTEGSSYCQVKWTGRKTYIQFGPFKTSLNTEVAPHRQESIIENY